MSTNTTFGWEFFDMDVRLAEGIPRRTNVMRPAQLRKKPFRQRLMKPCRNGHCAVKESTID
jgi:hypothetical protein